MIIWRLTVTVVYLGTRWIQTGFRMPQLSPSRATITDEKTAAPCSLPGGRCLSRRHDSSRRQYIGRGAQAGPELQAQFAHIGQSVDRPAANALEHVHCG